MALENESEVEIVGVDAESFVHLRAVKDEELKVSYGELQTKMQQCVSAGEVLKASSVKPLTECIVKDLPMPNGPVFARGVIEWYIQNTNIVLVTLVDHVKTARVLRSQLHYTNSEVLKHPSLTTKCILEGMEMEGFRSLEYAYKGMQKDPQNSFTLSVVSKDSSPPTVRLTGNGKSLSNTLSSYMAERLRLEYPQPSHKHYVRVKHMGEKGIMSVSSTADMYGFQGAIFKKLKAHRRNVLLGLHETATFNEKEILVYTTKHADKCFRVILLDEPSSEEDVTQRKALFLDTGRIATVNTKNLISASLVDPLLAIIPAQSVPVRYLGYKKQLLYGRQTFEKKLWFCVRNYDVLMQIKNVSNMEELPDGRYKQRDTIPCAAILFRERVRRAPTWEKAFSIDTILRGR